MKREEIEPMVIRYLSDGKPALSIAMAKDMGLDQDTILPPMFAMREDGILSHVWVQGMGHGYWSLSPGCMAVVNALAEHNSECIRCNGSGHYFREGEPVKCNCEHVLIDSIAQYQQEYPASKACATCNGTGSLPSDAVGIFRVKCGWCGGTGWAALGKS